MQIAKKTVLHMAILLDLGLLGKHRVSTGFLLLRFDDFRLDQQQQNGFFGDLFRRGRFSVRFVRFLHARLSADSSSQSDSRPPVKTATCPIFILQAVSIEFERIPGMATLSRWTLLSLSSFESVALISSRIVSGFITLGTKSTFVPYFFHSIVVVPWFPCTGTGISPPALKDRRAAVQGCQLRLRDDLGCASLDEFLDFREVFVLLIQQDIALFLRRRIAEQIVIGLLRLGFAFRGVGRFVGQKFVEIDTLRMELRQRNLDDRHVQQDRGLRIENGRVIGAGSIQ